MIRILLEYGDTISVFLNLRVKPYRLSKNVFVFVENKETRV